MLQIKFHNIFRDPECRFIISCIAGFSLGSFVSSDTGSIIAALMRFTVTIEMSIVSYMILVLLPLLITAFAVFHRKYVGVYIVCFAKTFLFGFAGQAISNSFSYCSWLIRPLILFTDASVLFVMLLFCYLKIKQGFVSLKAYIVTSVTLCSIAWLLDYFFISPYLAHLII